MKKFLLAVVGAVMLLIIPSAYYPTDSIVGEVAPNFEVSNDNKAVEIDNLRGRYILLSFWSSDRSKIKIGKQGIQRHHDWRKKHGGICRREF